MPFSCFAQSDPGLRRGVNEDAYCARPDLGLFVVADGLGGHPGGHVASRMVAEAIESVVGGTIDPAEAARSNIAPTPDPVRRFRDAFHVAHLRLALAAEGEDLHGMATTVAGILIETARPDPPGAYGAVVAHIGDSRVYRLHAGRLERLTRDHSWVEEQVRAGLLESDAARTHPWRSLITRAVSSSEDEVEPELYSTSLSAGDRLLVCSDGLSSVLRDEQIESVLAQPLADDAACESLVHMANLAGGPDNITVIVVSLL